MALKTKRPDYSSEDTKVKLDNLIGYIDSVCEEIEFRLESIQKMILKIRRVNSGNDEGE